MKSRIFITAFILVLLAANCAAGQDDDSNTYAFTIEGVTDTGGNPVTQVNGKAFHWERRPVRVKIRPCQYLDTEPEPDVLSTISECTDAHIDAAKRGIDLWLQNASVFGELSITYVDSDPDIVINWVRDFNSITSEPNQIGDCELNYAINTLTNEIFVVKPRRIRLAIIFGLSPEMTLPLNWTEFLAAHEIGHCMGLWQHSPVENDLMFAGLSNATEFSVRDVNTIRKLYSKRSDLSSIDASLVSNASWQQSTVSAPPFLVE